MNLNTAYVTYLKSVMVDPPIADRAKTIDDLMIRGIKFAADKRNFFALLEKPDYQKYG